MNPWGSPRLGSLGSSDRSDRVQGSSAAAATLLKLMLDPTTRPSTRARCAETVLSLATKAIEMEDIEA